jgi:hypothetical protein
MTSLSQVVGSWRVGVGGLASVRARAENETAGVASLARGRA